jgi:hypothetical protein
MTTSQSIVRLDKRRQRLIRLVWLAVMIPAGLMYLFSVDPLYDHLLTSYVRGAGEWQAILGLSPRFFVNYELTLFVIRRLVFSGVGLILFLKRSDEWVPLLLSVLFMLYDPNQITRLLAREQPALALSTQIIEYLWLAVTPLVMYLFPDGRFVPRWSLWLAAGWAVLLFALEFKIIGPVRQQSFSMIFNVAVVSGVLALIYRYRRSPAGQRQQLKWPVYSLAVWLVALVLSLAASYLLFGRAVRAVNLLHITVMLFVPVSVALSIFRYKLWDIDFIINRSLVFAGLALLFILIFAGALFLALTLSRGSSANSLLVLALSVTVFGLLFQGAHRRVQRFVDRRFYHINIPYQQPFRPVAPTGDGTSQILSATNFAQYRHLELIGRGGMAEVYRSVHPELGRPVAIKLMAAHLTADEPYRRRFLREARIAAGLDHPNIVRIYDYGELAGQLYMVMEYLDGQVLSGYLEQAGRLSLAQAGPILAGVAAALDYAHSQGVIHRDIKPGNVMIGSGGQDAAAANGSGRVVLMDFGLARLVGQRTSLTQGMLLGTLDYIPPEQIQAAEDIGPAADVYALGVMAYQMVTGQLPFQYQNPGALLIAHLNQPPPDPRRWAPELPDGAVEALQLALAKEPAHRLRSAGALAEALGAPVSQITAAG